MLTQQIRKFSMKIASNRINWMCCCQKVVGKIIYVVGNNYLSNKSLILLSKMFYSMNAYVFEFWMACNKHQTSEISDVLNILLIQINKFQFSHGLCLLPPPFTLPVASSNLFQQWNMGEKFKIIQQIIFNDNFLIVLCI